MNASPIRESACGSCGEKLAPDARFCPHCGAPARELLPLETVPGPVAHERVERRWFGLPARFALLCFGGAGVGASVGLFATGSWAWALFALFGGLFLLALLAEATRRRPGVWAEQSSRFAADGRVQAAMAAEVWRTRFDTTMNRWRTRTRLDEIELDRAPALQALGEAVWRGDSAAERDARRRLVDLEQERQRLEDELAQRLAGAEEKIRTARLPVQETLAVTPPDEGTPPTPAPDPGQTESDD